MPSSLLQYVRDEAHRFAQHYHHILRRKTTLEEDVKSGRRPPRAKSPRKARPTVPAEEAAKQPGEMPFTTHVGLPILQPVSADAPPDDVVDPADMLDPEDLPADAAVTAVAADLPPRSKTRGDRGVPGAHAPPPAGE